jgi:hypothetical protein
LLGVLSAFDALFKGVFETVPVCDVNAGMLLTEVMIRPDCDILIVWVSIYFVVWAAGESVCMIYRSWFIFE